MICSDKENVRVSEAVFDKKDKDKEKENEKKPNM